MNQFRSAFLPGSAPALRRALMRVARDAVPSLADFCFIYLATPTAISCAAAAHSTDTGARLIRTLARIYRIRPDDGHSTVAFVIRTGRPAIRNDIRVDTGSPPDLVDDLHRQLAPRSALVVPVIRLTARQLRLRPVGALSLCYAASGRAYSARDLRAARELAARVAQVLPFAGYPDARLRPAAGRPRQGTTVRRRVASRD